ncbi:hypothetical protein K503DRAFT_773343 [Rhizopogon vinicolor AM-OR11-026]|uniref:Uncharacterized protein n=1 Tax=Rhizopogon vinicolor AM-OR11-026 TaxID=1314800 RepID=A0A1B7MSH3_9AGAM|nr:hypothetical protein K503DRAFT_773343 [Rhizopogon vinicolor AM-OR11-026]
MVETVAQCRPNVMSLEYILCPNTALTAAPIQVSVQERKDRSTPMECTGVEISSQDEPTHAPSVNQPPPAVVNNILIYLDDFDNDEAPIVQLCSPVSRNLPSTVFGWNPPDGSEDVDIDQENLTYPSHVSGPASHRVHRTHDVPEHLTVQKPTRRRTRSKISTHPPAQLPRTRVVLAPTQAMIHRAQSPLSCGPTKGGNSPGVTLDVTKSHALRVERESKRRRAAAARAGVGRKPSV